MKRERAFWSFGVAAGALRIEVHSLVFVGVGFSDLSGFLVFVIFGTNSSQVSSPPCSPIFLV